MRRFQKIFGLGLISVIFILLGLFSPLLLPNVYSQNVSCISVTPRVINGILTTPSIQTNSKNGTLNGAVNGQCIVDLVQAGIVSFKIPTYDQLKNTYFERKTTTGSIDKKTISGNQIGLNLDAGGSLDRLWNITGNLTFLDHTGLTIANNQKGVIFVDGNMQIGDLNATTSDPASRTPQNFTYGNSGSGIVFIVKGDVNFGRNVHQFDGIIISQGVICTSVDAFACQKDEHSDSENGGETKQLVINGNLVSLDSSKPMRFERSLLFSTVAFPTGNTNPAEVINVQPKYLVVMKDLLSDFYTIQTEDTHYAINQ